MTTRAPGAAFAGGRWLTLPVMWTMALVCAVAIPCGVSAQSPRDAGVVTKLDVQTTPISQFDPRDATRRQFGWLRFRSGLVLKSSYKEFGGLSSLRMASDGEHFLTASDKGQWFRGRIVYDKGRMSGVTDVESAPMLGPDRLTLAERGWYDTESMAQDGGTIYVGIERVNEIVRFNYGKDGFAAHAQRVAAPAGIKTLPHNKGLEALAFVPKGLPLGGTLIAISERGLDADRNLKSYLIGGPTPGEFRIKRINDFDVGDAALLPDGDLLILERRFSYTRGGNIRIRRIALSTIKPGALVDGKELFSADLGYEIDNMEGLSVHRAADGDIVLTMVSDDNFSFIQRTLLLQFTLVE